MPTVAVNGVDLYYEEVGAGAPILFLHEFAGDYRSWEPQMRAFGRRYRAITTSYRGYPGSSVPDKPEDYSHDILIADIRALLDALGIEKAHLCGCSVGANASIAFSVTYPERCLSVTAVGVGHGSVKGAEREEFLNAFESRAQAILAGGMEAVVEKQSNGVSRLPMKLKDPRCHAEYWQRFLEHAPVGSAYTALGVPPKRPNFYDIEDELKRVEVPVLIMLGDQDAHCIEGSWFLKKTMPRAGILTFPMGGHVLNLEDPDLFNRAFSEFLSAVEAGNWEKPA
ncbi:MAG: alpha/beta hydrolase [Proteobacteria bacterium]|nr:alpha/beta hydrolase [Pseudomonadota bacterium]